MTPGQGGHEKDVALSKPRKPRLEELIREEVATILLHEVKDPRLRMITVSRAKVSKDLRHALIFVSTLEQEGEAELLEALEHAKGFIRSALGQRISLRFTPDVKFIFDRNFDHASRIEALLEQLKQEETAAVQDAAEARTETNDADHGGE
ncbi:30S ribosome-binding factor RbfA [Candidatus Sumerlaeota bacterium]|nr:30S ribosome-binding factor RbfA [Candidatus Sumerlaeota bacterium]